MGFVLAPVAPFEDSKEEEEEEGTGARSPVLWGAPVAAPSSGLLTALQALRL